MNGELRVVTININNRCPFHCRHCSLGFSETYRGDKSRLDERTLASIISGIDSEIYDMVLFAGGEPSLDVELIRVGIQAAQRSRLYSSVVTAPVWAKNVERALRFIEQVRGLNVLVLSYDDFHLEFLSRDDYRRAANAARLAGISPTFHVVYETEDDRERLARDIEELGVAVHVNWARAIGVGNAVTLHRLGRVVVTSPDDIGRLPRTCVLGNALVDSEFTVHGCCWSATADKSRLSQPAQLSTLRSAFAELEHRPTFRAIKAYGFIDALDSSSVQALTDRVHGEAFATECDLCIAAMREGMDDVWQRLARSALAESTG